MNYWLIKSEPNAYSWTDFVRDGSAAWTGVRNYQARNNLRTMQVGDLALFYHSNIGKEVVGVAEVTRTAYQDPTTDNAQWVCVEVCPQKTFPKPITLAAIKAAPFLASIGLLKQSQLSVVALTEDEFAYVCDMGK